VFRDRADGEEAGEDASSSLHSQVLHCEKN
jgi:hypothetical protein